MLDALRTAAGVATLLAIGVNAMIELDPSGQVVSALKRTACELSMRLGHASGNQTSALIGSFTHYL